MGKIVKNLALVVATLIASFTGSLLADNYGVQIGVGYRQDSLSWEQKDLGDLNPRAKSDLHFKDLEIVLLTTKFKGMLGCSFYNRTMFDYGWVVDGNLREQLTISHRREAEHFSHDGLNVEGSFSRAVTHNKIRRNSYVWDFNTGFGLPFSWDLIGFKVAPVIGFAYDRHNLKVRSREQIFAYERRHNSSGFESGNGQKDLECRDLCKRQHSFKTAWWGPYFGFDLAYDSNTCWTAFGEFEVHLGRAERSRNTSNGIDYFDRYKRTKFFWGTTARIGANYVLCQNLYLEAAISYTYRESDEHRDYIRLSSGSARVDLGYLF